MPKILHLDWAAGFFEGEGTVYIKKAKRSGDKYHRFVLSTCQVDKEAIDKFYVCVGVGAVRGPYGPYSGNRQPHYQWSVENDEAVKLANRLLPFLCGKGRQLSAKLQEWEDYNAKP